MDGPQNYFSTVGFQCKLWASQHSQMYQITHEGMWKRRRIDVSWQGGCVYNQYQKFHCSKWMSAPPPQCPNTPPIHKPPKPSKPLSLVRRLLKCPGGMGENITLWLEAEFNLCKNLYDWFFFSCRNSGAWMQLTRALQWNVNSKGWAAYDTWHQASVRQAFKVRLFTFT